MTFHRPFFQPHQMQITLKLFASLAEYLPAGTVRNALPVEVGEDVTLNSIIDQYRVPRDMAHLVLVNGVYVDLNERDTITLKEGDTVAVWPPVAGG